MKSFMSKLTPDELDGFGRAGAGVGVGGDSTGSVAGLLRSEMDARAARLALAAEADPSWAWAERGGCTAVTGAAVCSGGTVAGVGSGLGATSAGGAGLWGCTSGLSTGADAIGFCNGGSALKSQNERTAIAATPTANTARIQRGCARFASDAGSAAGISTVGALSSGSDAAMNCGSLRCASAGM